MIHLLILMIILQNVTTKLSLNYVTCHKTFTHIHYLNIEA